MKFIAKAQNYKLQADVNKPALRFVNGLYDTEDKAEIALIKKSAAFKEGFVIAVTDTEIK